MSFQKRCYKLLKEVPAGKVVTYKSLAKALNSKAYRTVGTAMRKNPSPIKIPCHRVIKSNGKIGNFNQGTSKKIQLLKSEGIKIKDNRIDLKEYEYNL